MPLFRMLMTRKIGESMIDRFPGLGSYSPPAAGMCSGLDLTGEDT